ncbi:MAG: hypothetical protein AB7V50_01340 [Vampirovibrionia bacterium]
MKGNLHKLTIISLICGISFTINSNISEIMAQKADSSEGKQATQTEVNEGIEQAKKTISALTKKIYARMLFSPQDNDKLIELKINLYNLWTQNPTNKALAEPLYSTGQLLIQREMYDEATEILNIVIESFPPFSASDEEDSGDEEGGGGGFSVDYSAKAKKLLEKMEKDLAKKEL